MDLKSLEAFVWVVRLGSFRLAAEKLNMTQPAVSQRIATLENELGRRLVDRDKRSIGPTPAGREALLYSEKLLNLRSEFVKALTDERSVSGFVRLGSAESIAHTWLSTFMKSVSERYPSLSVEMEVEGSAILRQRLLSQSIELAFLVGGLNAPGVRNIPLCTYDLSFVASPRLGLGGRMSSIEELAARPIITFARNTQPYEYVKQLFANSEQLLVRIHACASLATAIRMAEDGTGVAVIPEVIIADQVERGVLEVLSTAAKLPSLAFFASWLQAHDSIIPESLASIGCQIAKTWGVRTLAA